MTAMETRRQLESEYTVKDGRISSPGKFELEPLWAPYYWQLLLECGGADDELAEIAFFKVMEDERAAYPELGSAFGVSLAEDGNGFVYSRVHQTEDDYNTALAADE